MRRAPNPPNQGGDFAQSEGFKFNEDAKSCWGPQGPSCTRRHPALVLATILGLINANEGARHVLAPRSPGGLQRGAGALPGRRRRQRPARCFLFRCGWDFPALAVGPRSAPAAALFSISKAAEADALQRHCHFERAEGTAPTGDPRARSGDARGGGGGDGCPGGPVPQPCPAAMSVCPGDAATGALRA